MYALIKDGEVAKYPYTRRDLCADNPNTSFPRDLTGVDLSEFGVASVSATEYPKVDHTQNVTEGKPQLVDGEWVQVWVVTDATEEQIAERTAEAVAVFNAEREARLRETDWMVIRQAETGTPVPPDVTVQRQALRAMDDAEDFDLFNPAWPT